MRSVRERAVPPAESDFAGLLAGFSDFRSFTDDDPEDKSTRVLLDDLAIERHGSLLLVRVVGSHFLWKMVRRIVGVLVEIGRGALEPRAITSMLQGDSDLPARLTAPASGLFLEQVFYEAVPANRPLDPPMLRLT